MAQEWWDTVWADTQVVAHHSSLSARIHHSVGHNRVDRHMLAEQARRGAWIAMGIDWYKFFRTRVDEVLAFHGDRIFLWTSSLIFTNR
ncbi:AAEL017257-PA [Aedes aegypti]|uniref:AAEL017257-PA n=1 Tax=Aedes aegypti TaxID=7159 RepID=J9HJF0_AEDAE|nr:AAEL017257-PA [Aedes aegypti]